jgi:ABC-type multidrug transport system ATPase subunit
VPLEVSGLCKRYGPVVALDGVGLDVRAGSVVGLVGPNGSGKTTVLPAAAGLVRPDRGRALVAGAPAGSRAARSAVALVPDEPSGFDELTPAELVSLVHALWGAGPAARARAAVLVAAFGLGDRLGTRLGALSRGLRRQASAVAACSLAPPLLLIDEASATLDPEAVVVLRESVRALARRGCGVLLATQDLHFAARACDEVVLLAAGRVLERGAPSLLCERHAVDTLEDVFLAVLGEQALAERVRVGLAAL